MKATVGVLLVIGVALAGVYFFAPDRLKGQTSAILGFIASSFGRIFEVAQEEASDTKSFVISKTQETKEKAEEIINPPTPQEKRAELISELETRVTTIKQKAEEGTLTPEDALQFSEESEKIIAEVKEENDKKDKGAVGSIVDTVTNIFTDKENNQECECAP